METGTYGWASVKGGKWHRTTNLAPSFLEEERSLCGLTFTPYNVSDHRRPTYIGDTDRHVCRSCAVKVLRLPPTQQPTDVGRTEQHGEEEQP